MNLFGLKRSYVVAMAFLGLSLGQKSAAAQLSADQFLEKLPSAMWRYPVLVPVSLSGQPASVTAPRVILYQPDASLFVGFVSDPASPFYNTLEVATVDRVTAEPDFYFLYFREGEMKREKNPERCLKCHMINGRRHLRIEQYGEWAGWFGNYRNAIDRHIGATEKTRAYTFLVNQKNLPRLARQEWETAAAFLSETEFAGTRLGMLATVVAAKGIHHRLSQDSRFKEFQGALATNDPNLLPWDLQKDYQRFAAEFAGVIKSHQSNYKKYLAELFQKTDGPFQPGNARAAQLSSSALLEWALRRQGDSLVRYSTSGLAGSLPPDDGHMNHLTVEVALLVGEGHFKAPAMMVKPPFMTGYNDLDLPYWKSLGLFRHDPPGESACEADLNLKKIFFDPAL